MAQAHTIYFCTWPDGKVNEASLNIYGERWSQEAMVRQWLPVRWFGKELPGDVVHWLWRQLADNGFRCHVIRVPERHEPEAGPPSEAEGTAIAPEGRIHRLRVTNKFWNALVDGTKNFEARRDDRGFLVGDYLELCCYDPDAEAETGSFLRRRITYILPGGEYGVEDGFVVMGLEKLPL